jgi:hypothetical protein
MVAKTTQVTLLSSLVFFVAGFAIALVFGFTVLEALIVGSAATFSSTIIGLKLLPTTILHHQRTGEVIISILLLQDLIAIVLLLIVRGGSQGEAPLPDILLMVVALPALILFAWGFQRYVLIKADPSLRQDPRVHFSDDPGLVSRHGRARDLVGSVHRDRRLHRRCCLGQQPDLAVHRRAVETAA